MKRIMVVITGAILFTACGNNTKEGGTVNDGIQAVDPNGALEDSSGFQSGPSVDTAVGDHRVNTEKRDSSKATQQR